MKQNTRLTLVYSRGAAKSVTSQNEVGLKPPEFHPVIENLIARHQMLLAPVCTHSRYATLKPLCAPTHDLDLLASAAIPNCNWVVQIGPSLINVEVNLETGRESLAALSADEPEGWSDTLAFGDQATRFLFFIRPAQRLRFLGSRFPGVKVHSRESGLLQIPPSWFVSGAPLKWIDPDTAILGAPKWLLEGDDEESQDCSTFLPPRIPPGNTAA